MKDKSKYNNSRKDIVDICYNKSIQILEKNCSPNGIIASNQRNYANYNRLWARDSIVCGLAGLLAQNKIIIKSLKNSLLNLTKCQGDHGQIPSNISFEKNKIKEISYGGNVGRIDPTMWFIIGVMNYTKFTNDYNLLDNLTPHLKKALSLLEQIEFNNKGLLYIPQSGDWMDEQIFHGYILYDQILRIWALRCYNEYFKDSFYKNKIERLTAILQKNYWPDKAQKNDSQIIQKKAFINYLSEYDNPQHACNTIFPGGYKNRFDTIANALAILMDVTKPKYIESTYIFTKDLIFSNKLKLLPNIWPPIFESDLEYEQLKNNFTYEFRNTPHNYQNGGLWPIVNAWWGLALIHMNKQEDAEFLLRNICLLNKKNKKGEWGFFEYANAISGEVRGAGNFAWSAAAVVLLKLYINGQKLHYGSN